MVKDGERGAGNGGQGTADSGQRAVDSGQGKGCEQWRCGCLHFERRRLEGWGVWPQFAGRSVVPFRIHLFEEAGCQPIIRVQMVGHTPEERRRFDYITLVNASAAKARRQSGGHPNGMNGGLLQLSTSPVGRSDHKLWFHVSARASLVRSPRKYSPRKYPCPPAETHERLLLDPELP